MSKIKKSIDSRPALAMILKGYPRISETFISNEIYLLESLGYKVHIISMRKPREDFSHASISRIKADVTYLPSTLLTSLHKLLWPNIVMALTRTEQYLQALKIMFKRLGRSRKTATLKHMLQAGYAAYHLRDVPVAHLHAHFAHSPCSVALFTSKLMAIPFSFTGHAKDIYTSNPEQLAEKIQLAKFVVTCTEYNRRHLQKLADQSKPIHCVYHGIDLRLFTASPGCIHPPAEPYHIMTVARMVEKKGLPTVLNALALLHKQGVDFHYTLIGTGELSEEAKSLAKDLGLLEKITFTGAMAHEQVLEHYRKSDLFVIGCQIAANKDRDGIPNVLAESLAMGVPVVATDVSGIPELITDRETGLLVEPKNPSVLAEAMLTMLTDTDLRSKCIKQGLLRVAAIFDNRPLIRRLGEIYAKYGIKPGKKN